MGCVNLKLKPRNQICPETPVAELKRFGTEVAYNNKQKSIQQPNNSLINVSLENIGKLFQPALFLFSWKLK